jgi:hypothetical protein
MQHVSTPVVLHPLLLSVPSALHRASATVVLAVSRADRNGSYNGSRGFALVGDACVLFCGSVHIVQGKNCVAANRWNNKRTLLC